MLGGGEEAFVELGGGCVCGALNDDLYETLYMLREQVDPDRIVIETSGAAIPHDGALRTKGFVVLDTGEALVQGVGRRIEFCPPPAPVPEEMLGRVVVIRRVE